MSDQEDEWLASLSSDVVVRPTSRWFRLAKTKRLCSRHSGGVRSHMKAVTFIGAICMLVGCGKREGYEVCFGDGANDKGICRTFRSEEHYERWLAADQISRKAVAERLPNDYREIVAETLREYLGSGESEFMDVKEQFFISVFGSDVDTTVQAKLLEHGIEAQPASAFVESYGTKGLKDDAGRFLWNTSIDVSSLERLDDGSYRVGFSYWCGMLCAGGLQYVLKKEEEGWIFLSKKMRWVS
jgi:hypothetical protein